MKLNLSELVAAKTTNPKGQNFMLKFNPEKETITFSNKLFAELQLEYNSLAFYPHPEAVLIGVCPGDSGTFYKKIKGRSKGKTVKNKVLTEALVAAGVPKGKLDYIYEGEENGVKFYSLMEEQPQTSVAEEPHKDEPKPESNDVQVTEDTY